MSQRKQLIGFQEYTKLALALIGTLKTLTLDVNSRIHALDVNGMAIVLILNANFYAGNADTVCLQ